MDELTTIVRQNVLTMRQRLGWTHAELADRAGLDRTAVYRFESAQRGASLALLGKLAHGLGVPPGVLLRRLTEPEAELLAQQATPPLTAQEQDVLVWFRRMPEDLRLRAAGILQGLARAVD
jgi:transcriptional regulator with XRE-family HTH domain